MINLPIIDYSDLTLAQQIKKIAEEYGEVCEALMNHRPVDVIRESLDCIQTHWTLINMIVNDYKLDLDRLFREHVQKLRAKGYITDEPAFDPARWMESLGIDSFKIEGERVYVHDKDFEKLKDAASPAGGLIDKYTVWHNGYWFQKYPWPS